MTRNLTAEGKIYVHNDPMNHTDPFGLEDYAVAVRTDKRRSDEYAFIERGERLVGSGNVRMVNTGQDILTEMRGMANIERIDINSHGATGGVIGNDGLGGYDYQGLYVDHAASAISSTTHPGVASASELADAIISGNIDLANGGEINFFGYNTYYLADQVSSALSIARPDIRITGTFGSLYEENGTLKANGYYDYSGWNDGQFYTYQAGTVTNNTDEIDLP